MRPFAVLALNVAIGSVGFWVGGFAGGCLIAALVVADCLAVLAEGRAWAKEDREAAQDSASLEPRPHDGWSSEGPIRESRPGANRNPAVVAQVGDAELYDWARDWAQNWNAKRGREGRAG